MTVLEATGAMKQGCFCQIRELLSEHHDQNCNNVLGMGSLNKSLWAGLTERMEARTSVFRSIWAMISVLTRLLQLKLWVETCLHFIVNYLFSNLIYFTVRSNRCRLIYLTVLPGARNHARVAPSDISASGWETTASTTTSGTVEDAS